MGRCKDTERGPGNMIPKGCNRAERERHEDFVAGQNLADASNRNGR